jgi:hypothetical protein
MADMQGLWAEFDLSSVGPGNGNLVLWTQLGAAERNVTVTDDAKKCAAGGSKVARLIAEASSTRTLIPDGKTTIVLPSDVPTRKYRAVVRWPGKDDARLAIDYTTVYLLSARTFEITVPTDVVAGGLGVKPTDGTVLSLDLYEDNPDDPALVASVKQLVFYRAAIPATIDVYSKGATATRPTGAEAYYTVDVPLPPKFGYAVPGGITATIAGFEEDKATGAAVKQFNDIAGTIENGHAVFRMNPKAQQWRLKDDPGTLTVTLKAAGQTVSTALTLKP